MYRTGCVYQDCCSWLQITLYWAPSAKRDSIFPKLSSTVSGIFPKLSSTVSGIFPGVHDTHTHLFFSHWSRTKRFSTERRSFDLYIIYSKAADAATLDRLGKERETILGLPRWYLVFFIERLPSGQADEDAVFQEPSRASRVHIAWHYTNIFTHAATKVRPWRGRKFS